MDYGELASDVRRGRLHHVYLLCGEETYFLRKARELIVQTLLPEPGEMEAGLTVLDGDPPLQELIDGIHTAPFLASKAVTVVNRTRLFREKKSENAEGEKTKKADKDTEKLINALITIPPDNYVIFVTPEKADKRRKLYKSFLKIACVMEATPFRPWEAQGQIRAMTANLPKPLERDAMTQLENMLSVMQQVSLDFVVQELNKMQLYASGNTVTKADVINSFSALPEVSIFALIEAISAGDTKKALTLLTQELKNGTAWNMILAILVKHVRQLWQAKEFLARRIPIGEIGAKLGINPYIGRKIGQAARNFDGRVLKETLLWLSDADYKMKTGQGDTELLEGAVIMLCQNKPMFKFI